MSALLCMLGDGLERHMEMHIPSLEVVGLLYQMLKYTGEIPQHSEDAFW